MLGSLRTDASSATLDPRSPEGRSGVLCAHVCATPLTKVSGATCMSFPVSRLDETVVLVESDAHIHAQARDNTVTSSQQHLAPPGCTAPTSDVRREKADRAANPNEQRGARCAARHAAAAGTSRYSDSIPSKVFGRKATTINELHSAPDDLADNLWGAVRVRLGG